MKKYIYRKCLLLNFLGVILMGQPFFVPQKEEQK